MFDNILIKELKCSKLAKDAAPSFFQAVEEIAARLKIPAPDFFLTGGSISGHPNFMNMHYSPGAFSISKKTVLISPSLLEALGNSDLSKPISDELRAVIAHEMHHCANFTSLSLMKFAPVLALPAAAMTGLYLYNNAKANAAKEGDTSKEKLVEHVHKEADKLHDTLPEEAKASWLMRAMNTTAKYMAVAAVGVGVGLLLTRQGARYHEFAADAFASEASHNRNSIIRALEKIFEYAGINVAEHDKMFKGVMNETFGAHPSLAERAAHVHSR